ncbi:hypothetical protein OG21DRAFT_1515580, partial [Imleria badia]
RWRCRWRVFLIRHLILASELASCLASTRSASPAPRFCTHPPLPLAGSTSKPVLVRCTSLRGSLSDLLGAHPTLAARSPPQCFGPKSP